MKKPFLLTTFLILSVTMSIGQSSRFPIKQGSVWRINYEYFSNCWDGEFVHLNGDEEYKYFIDGDTVVGARSYFKIFKTGIIYLDSPFMVTHKYMGAIRDSADRVYFVPEEEQAEKMLYDFAIAVGDSISMEGTGMSFPVSSVTTLENGRKQYIIDIMTVHCGSANTIIEGIGWLGGLLEGNSCSGHPGVRGSYLVCYAEDDQVIYQNIQTRCGVPLVCDDIVVSSDNLLKPLLPEVTVLSGNQLSVDISDDSHVTYNLCIYSAIGHLTYNKISELPVLVDLSMWSSGIYLLKLENKVSSSTTKFVIP